MLVVRKLRATKGSKRGEGYTNIKTKNSSGWSYGFLEATTENSSTKKNPIYDKAENNSEMRFGFNLSEMWLMFKLEVKLNIGLTTERITPKK